MGAIPNKDMLAKKWCIGISRKIENVGWILYFGLRNFQYAHFAQKAIWFTYLCLHKWDPRHTIREAKCGYYVNCINKNIEKPRQRLLMILLTLKKPIKASDLSVRELKTYKLRIFWFEERTTQWWNNVMFIVKKAFFIISESWSLN